MNRIHKQVIADISTDPADKFKHLHPFVYEQYKAFLATGKYPYLTAVTDFIAAQLPPITEEQKKRLHTQVYNASNYHDREQEKAFIAKMQADGWGIFTEEAVSEAVNLGKKVILSRGAGEQVYKPFINSEGKAFLMKPRATRKGWYASTFVGNNWGDSNYTMFKLA